MYLKLFLLSASVTFFMACGTKTSDSSKDASGETTNGASNDDTTSKKGNTSECFRFSGTTDTINLRISETYNIMAGFMIYKINQKDQNRGTLEGKMMGDMLIADYTFMSEGVTSVRQVAFKKVGNDLVEGFGEIVEANGKMVFKDVNSLTLDATRVLKNVPCKN